ncbi:hypothetical protein, partial [Stenotrophomonas maltophilia group sp. RNC7]|uniref:Eco57I restriction-modification methylase domain-containing protein n=1 Tax=Stenotrophomonas maltophilia group sp. RNC7 TaxID=3071467 RepID=UPI0027DF7264
LLKSNGQMVYLTPRSYFSGKSYSKLRSELIRQGSIERIHHFRKRDKIFGSDILQESVITKIVKNHDSSKKITITRSDSIEDIQESTMLEVSKEKIIYKENFILIPENNKDLEIIMILNKFRNRFKDINLKFSTGKIVDFRNLQYLKDTNTDTSIP